MSIVERNKIIMATVMFLPGQHIRTKASGSVRLRLGCNHLPTHERSFFLTRYQKLRSDPQKDRHRRPRLPRTRCLYGTRST